MKKVLILFMVISLMIGACGCMMNKAKTKDELVKNMVQYMNDKYTDDSFEYKGAFGGGAGSDTKTIIVSSQNFPNKDIYVRYNFNDTEICTDNYLGVCYEEQTKYTISSVLDEVLDTEFIVFYDVDRFACPNLDGKLSFDEYIADSNSCIGFNIVVNGIVSDRENFENSLENAVVKAGLCCSGTVYFDNGSGEFSSLDSKGISAYTFKELYTDVFSFEMNDNTCFSTSDWGE